MKPHIEIECDPRVSDRVEALIRSIRGTREGGVNPELGVLARLRANRFHLSVRLIRELEEQAGFDWQGT
jgi:hypothetical protein